MIDNGKYEEGWEEEHNPLPFNPSHSLTLDQAAACVEAWRAVYRVVSTHMELVKQDKIHLERAEQAIANQVTMTLRHWQNKGIRR